MTNVNASRWQDLNEKYSRAVEIGRDDNFRLTRFARQVRKAFSESCGCDESAVFYYHYEFSHSPDYDKSKQVASPIEAVSKIDAGWNFGLGVEVGGWPQGRTIFIFWLEVRPKPNSFDVRCSLFTGEETLETDTPHYTAAVHKLAERMYEGFSTNLAALAGQTQSSHGFRFG